MDNSFKSIIGQAKSVLVLLPREPTFDQVAAGLALYLVIRQQKQTSIVTTTPMVVDYNRLVGVNKISQELGNKDLIIRFSDYKANDIERVSYDIEDGSFRLTVIPKSEVAAPQKEQIKLSYAGISSDTIIIVGGVDESHFPAAFSGDLSGAKIVHVGVRALSTQKKIISFGQAASSDSEIVASLIYQSGWQVDADIATNLLMGIEEGSSKFSKPEVNANTFAIVSELIRAGGRRLGQTISPKTYPPGAIPGQIPQPQPQTQQHSMQQPLIQKKSSVVQQVQPQSQRSAQQVKDSQRQEDTKNPPKDWLKPKIFKGTSTS